MSRARRTKPSRGGLSTGMVVAIGVGVVVVGAGVAIAVASTGDSSTSKPSVNPQVGGGAAKGFTVNQGTGLRVGPGCNLEIQDLAAARGAAFRAGRDHNDLEAARRALFNFGECGAGPDFPPLKFPPSLTRDVFLLEYELWRGAVAGGHLLRVQANARIAARLLALSKLGINTDGLPTKV